MPYSIALLVLLLTFVSPTTESISMSPITSFKATLRRVDSGGNFTKLELLQRASRRGRKRVQALAASILNADPYAPVQRGDQEDFIVELSIGTTPVPFHAILDTGSDLIWTQCQPCQHCFNQLNTPIFDPTYSTSFSTLACSSKLCRALPGTSCFNDQCQYHYGYTGGATTEGILAAETFTFGDQVSVKGIAFGCGLAQNGNYDDQSTGLLGLGRGPLSLVSQLEEPIFSYCLTPMFDTTKTSNLVFGYHDLNIPAGIEIMTTPLIQNPIAPTFYYVALKGITVGDTLSPMISTSTKLFEDGSVGAMILDSGTTLTLLEESAFNIIKEEFGNRINLPAANQGPLQACFSLPGNDVPVTVPRLTFHFEGLDLELSPDNYFFVYQDVGCLAMGSNTEGSISVFGSYMQQNLLVIHDLLQETVAFVPRQCGGDQ